MSSPIDPNVPQGDAAQPPERRESLGAVFMGPNGLRAGWRLSIYIVLVIAVGFVVLTPLSLFLLRYKDLLGPGFSPASLIFNEGALALVVLVAAWTMSLIEKRPFGEYGTPQNQALGKRFWQGMLWGLAMVSALVGLIAAVGAYSFGPLALGRMDILRNGILWLIGFGFVGVFEEFSFRGYAQYTLASGIGFWPAATLLSAGFGAIHLRNPGEGLVGGLSVFVIAMFFCFTLRRTGNLWFAIGLHCSFDWGETFLYSVPNSGLVVTKCLSHATLHGAKWITGGTIGPEGSVFCFLIVALVFLLFHRFYPAKHA
jgi:membrane protease YdiL (CAAX protease family)